MPHPQLLRWAEWFSKFAFDVIHIKGKHNVLADILSRPSEFSAQVHHPVEVFMFQPSSSKGKATQLGAFPSAWINKTYHSEISTSQCRYRSLQKYLCQINRIIPEKIWPSEDILASRDKDVPLTLYQEQLRQALVEYQTNIPNPKEWSQEYPIL
uniref:Reverse transcriptase RNase H-like domain-containing protein n=1 Tax=Gossypium raimondii TaxID=29730 RepID=A0A0D2RAV5_GOSRA|nr:hypothetical protein B456_002G225500 [Gossypium raimondii]